MTRAPSVSRATYTSVMSTSVLSAFTAGLAHWPWETGLGPCASGSPGPGQASSGVGILRAFLEVTDVFASCSPTLGIFLMRRARLTSPDVSASGSVATCTDAHSVGLGIQLNSK